MKKFFVLILCFFIYSECCVFSQESVKSTEGVEIDTNIVKTVKQQSKEYSQAIKRQNKAQKKYLKNIKRIKNMRNSKRIKERDLEFLNKRLNIKKNQLLEYSNSNEGNEKGEKL